MIFVTRPSCSAHNKTFSLDSNELSVPFDANRLPKKSTNMVNRIWQRFYQAELMKCSHPRSISDYVSDFEKSAYECVPSEVQILNSLKSLESRSSIVALFRKRKRMRSQLLINRLMTHESTYRLFPSFFPTFSHFFGRILWKSFSNCNRSNSLPLTHKLVAYKL